MNPEWQIGRLAAKKEKGLAGLSGVLWEEIEAPGPVGMKKYLGE